MHTHADSAFDNRVTPSVDLLTSLVIRAEQLPCNACLPNLALIAQVVFLLKRGHI